MSEELCTAEYEQAPFCKGPSEPIIEDSCLFGVACDPRWDEGGEWWPDEDYELDCASGPDPFTDEWWGAEGSDWWNECAAPLLEVELGEPQVIEREDYLENGVVTSGEATTVATVAHDDADILPVTGAEVPALAALGVAALLGGAAVLRRFSRA